MHQFGTSCGQFKLLPYCGQIVQATRAVINLDEYYLIDYSNHKFQRNYLVGKNNMMCDED